MTMGRTRTDKELTSTGLQAYEVTLFFTSKFAEKVGVDPNPFHRTSCFQDSPAGRRSSFSN
jgi:hypothetical protein